MEHEHAVELPEDTRRELDNALAEHAGYGVEEIECAHVGLTAAVTAYNVESDASDDAMCQDPTTAPAWLAEALSETIRRLGFDLHEPEVVAGDPYCLGHTTFGVIAPFGLRGPLIPVPDQVEIRAGMTPSSRSRMLCHELVHCIMGPHPADPDDPEGEVGSDASELIAESAAALVMGLLKAGTGEYSVHKIARCAASEDSAPYGDRRLMEWTRPHAVLLAGQILLGLQAWQDYQADQVTAGI